jgi:fibronectin type 3 domain-containing protein
MSLFLFAATLLWNANTETNVAGYRVYHGSQSRQYAAIIDVGTNTEWRITNMAPLTFFAVTAYDTDGLESDFSDEVSWQPGGTNAITIKRSQAKRVNANRIRMR